MLESERCEYVYIVVFVSIWQTFFSFQTVLVYDEFLMVLHLENVNTSNLQGRYKAVITLEAFDEHNVRRPSSLCVEIRGDLERVT